MAPATTVSFNLLRNLNPACQLQNKIQNQNFFNHIIILATYPILREGKKILITPHFVTATYPIAKKGKIRFYNQISSYNIHNFYKGKKNVAATFQFVTVTYTIVKRNKQNHFLICKNLTYTIFKKEKNHNYIPVL